MGRHQSWVGQSIYHKGKRLRPKITREEYTARLIAAAADPSLQTKQQDLNTGNPRGCLDGPPDEFRCVFINKNGRRCKKWRMRGATRCSKHGGLRENPEHPASAKRIDWWTRIRQEPGNRAKPSQDIATARLEQDVANALKSKGLPHSDRDRLREGAELLRMDDGGTAWRRWLARQRAIAPTGEMKARRNLKPNRP